MYLNLKIEIQIFWIQILWELRLVSSVKLELIICAKKKSRNLKNQSPKLLNPPWDNFRSHWNFKISPNNFQVINRSIAKNRRKFQKPTVPAPTSLATIVWPGISDERPNLSSGNGDAFKWILDVNIASAGWLGEGWRWRWRRKLERSSTKNGKFSGNLPRLPDAASLSNLLGSSGGTRGRNTSRTSGEGRRKVARLRSNGTAESDDAN